jgi:hypothetical protein
MVWSSQEQRRPCHPQRAGPDLRRAPILGRDSSRVVVGVLRPDVPPTPRALTNPMADAMGGSRTMLSDVQPILASFMPRARRPKTTAHRSTPPLPQRQSGRRRALREALRPAIERAVGEGICAKWNYLAMAIAGSMRPPGDDVGGRGHRSPPPVLENASLASSHPKETHGLIP